MASNVRNPLLIWACCLLVGMLLRAGPEAISTLVGQGMRDSIGATLKLTRTFLDGSPASESSENPRAHNDNVLQLLQAENRELARMIAQLRAENDQLRKAAPIQTDENAPPLLTVEAVSARILGRCGNPLSESLQLMISLGQAQGIRDSELVLSGKGLLIDQGKAVGLAPDQLITAGRALFGRTVHVGRQTALVQPVTDPEFRMGVRIVRRSRLGAIQGPRGILAGTGEGCRLDEVPATEAVAVGDDVYTDQLVSPGAEPVYCGTVTRADVSPSDSHWTIEVAPMHSANDLPSELVVLKTNFNPERLTGQPTDFEIAAAREEISR